MRYTVAPVDPRLARVKDFPLQTTYDKIAVQLNTVQEQLNFVQGNPAPALYVPKGLVKWDDITPERHGWDVVQKNARVPKKLFVPSSLEGVEGVQAHLNVASTELGKLGFKNMYASAMKKLRPEPIRMDGIDMANVQDIQTSAGKANFHLTKAGALLRPLISSPFPRLAAAIPQVAAAVVVTLLLIGICIRFWPSSGNSHANIST